MELLALALFKLIPDLSYSEFGERISSSGRQNEKNELLSRLVSYTHSKIVKFYTDQSLCTGIPRIYIYDLFFFILIDRVRSSYPDEKNYVDQRQKELQDLWNSLQVRDCYR